MVAINHFNWIDWIDTATIMGNNCRNYTSISLRIYLASRYGLAANIKANNFMHVKTPMFVLPYILTCGLESNDSGA